MQILRVPPYSIEAEISVSEASTEYSYTVEDMVDLSLSSGTVTSDSNAVVTIELPSNIDNSYLIRVDGEEVLVDVVRPYVDANTKANTASEILKYKNSEELARAIIDSVIVQGFYYKKSVIQQAGLGADYLPVWIDAKKVLKVYENNVLIFDASDPASYDRNFEITPDGTAIVQTATGAINRSEGKSVTIPMAASDTDVITYYSQSFASGVDYTIYVESGPRNIPADIVRATELLVDDIDCGRMEYFKRYATSYNTDQFKIQFDKQLFDGTGNLVVDKILSKYLKPIQTLGVL